MLVGRLIKQQVQYGFVSAGNWTTWANTTKTGALIGTPSTYAAGDLLVAFMATGGSWTPNTNATWSASSTRSLCTLYVKIADGDSTDDFTHPDIDTAARGGIQMAAFRIKSNSVNATHENGVTFNGTSRTDFEYPGQSVQSFTGETIIISGSYKSTSAGNTVTGPDAPLQECGWSIDSGRLIAWGGHRTDTPDELSTASWNPSITESLSHYGAAFRFNLFDA